MPTTLYIMNVEGETKDASLLAKIVSAISADSAVSCGYSPI